MLEEQLISFETAKLAVEKGYDGIIGKWRGSHYYNHKGELDGDVAEQLKESFQIKREQNISLDEADKLNPLKSYPAPTQSLLQKWLREKHSVHIEIDLDTDDKFYILKPYKYVIDIYQDVDHKFCKEMIETYEEALEIGLQEALKLI